MIAEPESVEGRVQRWCEEEHLLKDRLDEDKFYFHFIVEYGGKNYHVGSPKGSTGRIEVVSPLSLPAEHQKSLQEMEPQSRNKLYWNLRFFFLNRAVFNFQMEDGILQKLLLKKVIFEDGLSKDRLMNALQDVHDTSLGAVWRLQQALGGKPQEITQGTDEDLRYIG